jgi:hypothetical protein
VIVGDKVAALRIAVHIFYRESVKISIEAIFFIFVVVNAFLVVLPLHAYNVTLASMFVACIWIHPL